jgi:hypothetical protein
LASTNNIKYPKNRHIADTPVENSSSNNYQESINVFLENQYLKKDIVENKVSEAENFKYLIFHIVITPYHIALSPVKENPTMLDILTHYFDVFMFPLMLYYLYKCNKGNEGTRFAERFLALNFVFGIRYGILLIVIYSIGFIFHLINYDVLGFFMNQHIIIIQIIGYLNYAYFLGRHFKNVVETSS